MPMTRQDRVNSQKKQDKILILDGVPLAADLKEGVPTLRKTKEGLVEYVKHANVLYKNVMKLAAKADVAPAVVSKQLLLLTLVMVLLARVKLMMGMLNLVQVLLYNGVRRMLLHLLKWLHSL